MTIDSFCVEHVLSVDLMGSGILEPLFVGCCCCHGCLRGGPLLCRSTWCCGIVEKAALSAVRTEQVISSLRLNTALVIPAAVDAHAGGLNSAGCHQQSSRSSHSGPRIKQNIYFWLMNIQLLAQNDP